MEAQFDPVELLCYGDPLLFCKDNHVIMQIMLSPPQYDASGAHH
jgi:hypothetical protein